MATELYWHGQEDIDVFHDAQRNIEYWPSERPHDVPDEAVEWYLSFPGWTRSQEPHSGSEEEQESAGDFDAEAFILDNWQTVKTAILAGDVDDHLDAVEQAEADRSPGPRDSIMSAIEQRRETLQ